MALRQDFETFVGEDFRLRVTLNPVPTGGIAAYTFEFTSRMPVTDATVFIEHLNADFTIEDADAAIFYVDIADTETDTTPLPTIGDYAYSIKRMDAGQEAVLVHGTWTLSLPATRDNDA